MLDLDLARLSPEVAKIIMLRGAESPSLQWQEHPNLGAKRTLDTIEDSRLFGAGVTLDEGMAAAVRGLLYIWNGWIGECKMYAQGAPDRERFHITAFCERMEGHANSAKEHFQKTGENPLFAELHAYAVKSISPGAAPEVHRFRKVLEQIQGWEPYAFCDLYTQALSGQLGTSSVVLVMSIQAREFEILFSHCYQAATGVDFNKKPVKSPQAGQGPTKLQKKRKSPVSRATSRPAAGSTRKAERNPSAREKNAGKEGPAKPAGNPPVRLMIRVVCPSCREKLTFPSSARGKKHKCPECRSGFLIPEKKKTTKPATPSSAVSGDIPPGGVRILCPRCKGLIVLPDSTRGQRESCPECGASFIVPNKKPQSAFQTQPQPVA